jgi:hypothetical protein
MRRAGFVLCLLLIFGYEGYAIFVQEAGATANIPPAHDLHLTREINQTNGLRQTFVPHANGLQAVEVFPRRSDQPAIGPMEVTLSVEEIEIAFNLWTPLARTTLDPAALDLTGVARVTFPRIDRSAGRNFRIDIRLPNAPRGHGLRFEAGGPTYSQGFMQIGEQREWGDLKFRTVAQRTTIFRHILHRRATLPAPLQTDVFWITALVALNWALATLLYYLAFAADTVRQRPNGSASGIADQPRV